MQVCKLEGQGCKLALGPFTVSAVDRGRAGEGEACGRAANGHGSGARPGGRDMLAEKLI